MRIYIYSGGEKLVGRSGVGQAIRHQRECLRRSGVATTDRWTADAAAVHVNTILPDSVLAALGAKLRRRKVVWYGHSTMEDFRSSFKGSNVLAPLFKRWITFCYGLGDVVLTPTEYSRRLLEGYGLKNFQRRGHGVFQAGPCRPLRPADPVRTGGGGEGGGFRGAHDCPEGTPGIFGAGPADAGGGVPLVRLDES